MPKAYLLFSTFHSTDEFMKALDIISQFFFYHKKYFIDWNAFRFCRKLIFIKNVLKIDTKQKCKKLVDERADGEKIPSDFIIYTVKLFSRHFTHVFTCKFQWKSFSFTQKNETKTKIVFWRIYECKTFTPLNAGVLIPFDHTKVRQIIWNFEMFQNKNQQQEAKEAEEEVERRKRGTRKKKYK